jgi:hypothetical protein
VTPSAPLNSHTEERRLYEEYRNRALRIVSEALNPRSKSEMYLNALQQINSLRMICKLGPCFSGSMTKSRSQSPSSQERSEQLAQQYFNAMAAVGDIVCSQCGSNIGVSSLVSTKDDTPLRISRCQKVSCSNCSIRTSEYSGSSIDCGHVPVCDTYPVALADDASDLHLRTTPTFTGDLQLPTKISALLKHLKNNERGDKR